jgi:hypothetical protein
MPDTGWCCRACQEYRHLECVAAQTTELMKHRLIAAAFLRWFISIDQGQYGGVELSNLFD